MTRMKVFILLAAFTVLFSSCQKQESDPVIRTAETTYYNSYSVMLDLQGEAHLKTAFKIDDHICASCFCYDNGKEIYSIRLLDKTDGKIVSSQDITLGYTASLCCKTGDNKIVYSNGRIKGKPDPEIYIEACRRMACDVKKSVMIGNKLDVDCMGAVNAGMSAILVNSTLDEEEKERVNEEDIDIIVLDSISDVDTVL
jgi:hypothetical protein